MIILVTLELYKETSNGFPVGLRIRKRDNGGIDNEVSKRGCLPSIPENLQATYKAWSSGYWSSPGRLTRRDTPTNFSHTDCWDNLKKELNEWLNSGSSDWQPIRDCLIRNGSENASDEIRVIIDTNDIRLRRLPWQEWNLLRAHFPQAEVALNAPRIESRNAQKRQQQVRILLVEGCNQDINTNFDVKIIENLRTRGAEVTSLRQPDPRKIQDELRRPVGYHILIFTGHSISDSNGQIGWIELNQNDRLRIEDFERALTRAISNGLQLAIFNSCDGLGLANQLELPQSIVMREPVPDQVAQEFLEHFFNEFTAGNSLFASVREAQERLEHWNITYPGVKWLPTLCIGTTVTPVTWESLVQKRKFDPVLARWVAGVGSGAIALLAMTLMLSQYRPITTPKEKTPERPSKLAEVKTPPGNWQYSSSPAWKEIADRIEYEIEKVHPNFNIVHHEHQNPIDFLFKGQVAFVLSSRPINDEDITRARDRGWELEQVAIVTGTELVGCSQLFIIFRKDGQLDQEAGVAYSKLLLLLTDDGQKLIKSCGQVTLGNVN